MAGLTFLRVVGNDELVRQEKEAIDQALQERQSQPMILGLTAYIRTCWDAARIAKKPIEHKMLKAMRQRAGEYEPDKLSAIARQGGSEIFMGITEVKCRAAESWVRDILLDTGEPPFDIIPTPIPKLAPQQEAEIQEAFGEKVVGLINDTGQAPTKEEMAELKEMVSQDYRFRVIREAQMRADKMRQKIDDQFAQGGWVEAFNEFITDLTTFPAAFLKGPVVRRQRMLEWVTDLGGNTEVKAGERLAPEFERVDPFKIYPEPGITRLEDGYLFEHHPLSRTDLAELIGVPGYDEDAIRAILDVGAGVSWFNDENEIQKGELENKFYTHMRPTQVYDALEFWGKISGKMLLEWGLSEEEIPDPSREYDANVWLVGDYAIKAVLNYDPLGQKPYCKTSFIKTPGSLWGRSIPETIEDVQSICNAAARALVNNMGISSGPQVEVNLERIPPNEDITQIYPWKIWQVTNDPMGASAPAVRFTQPEDNAQTLMAVFERFSRMADDHSGIPAYIYGDINVQGAGRTSSGLSMLMGAAGKGIRQVISHIDGDIIKPVVQRQFVYNMRYDEDESIKGDAEIVARGAINLAVKETVNVRRIEFLNATANPVDMEIMGVDGRAAVLREVAKGLQMPVDEVVPTREKSQYLGSIKAKAEAAQAQQGGQPQETEADGSPRGGREGNVVSNRDSGAA